MIDELHFLIFYDIHAVICVIVVFLNPGNVGKKTRKLAHKPT